MSKRFLAASVVAKSAIAAATVAAAVLPIALSHATPAAALSCGPETFIPVPSINPTFLAYQRQTAHAACNTFDITLNGQSDEAAIRVNQVAHVRGTVTGLTDGTISLYYSTGKNDAGLRSAKISGTQFCSAPVVEGAVECELTFPSVGNYQVFGTFYPTSGRSLNDSLWVQVLAANDTVPTGGVAPQPTSTPTPTATPTASPSPTQSVLPKPRLVVNGDAGQALMTVETAPLLQGNTVKYFRRSGLTQQVVPEGEGTVGADGRAYRLLNLRSGRHILVYAKVLGAPSTQLPDPYTNDVAYVVG